MWFLSKKNLLRIERLKKSDGKFCIEYYGDDKMIKDEIKEFYNDLAVEIAEEWFENDLLMDTWKEIMAMLKKNPKILFIVLPPPQNLTGGEPKGEQNPQKLEKCSTRLLSSNQCCLSLRANLKKRCP